MDQQRHMERSHHFWEMVPTLTQQPMEGIAAILAQHLAVQHARQSHRWAACNRGRKILQRTLLSHHLPTCRASRPCAIRLHSRLRMVGASKSSTHQRGAQGALNRAHRIRLAAVVAHPLLQTVHHTLQEARSVGAPPIAIPSAPFDTRKGRTVRQQLRHRPTSAATLLRQAHLSMQCLRIRCQRSHRECLEKPTHSPNAKITHATMWHLTPIRIARTKPHTRCCSRPMAEHTR